MVCWWHKQQNAIPFDAIQGITLYDRAGPLRALDALNPFAHDLLLRVDYAGDADGDDGDDGDDPAPQTVGFELPSARDWGQRLAIRCDVRLEVHAGRKKSPAR